MPNDAVGPLAGIRVLELGGIGSGPFGAMALNDLGAEVIRVERPHAAPDPLISLQRGRRSIAVDLKDPRGADAARRLADTCDVVTEGFRPGVCERLGLGPDELMARNPRLVYARMTGWGQDGPWANAPGHDINYLALTGALHAIGPAGGDPVPPLNLVADYGGGGLLMAYGVVCALLRARIDGRGQVVDAAMVDGIALMLTGTYGMMAQGWWRDERGVNIIDGGAPFYRAYRCADGGHLAVGCLEPQFYAEFLRVLGLTDDPDFAHQLDQTQWPVQHRRLEAVFAERSRDEWASLFEGTQACATPVLTLREAPAHPHHASRGTFHNGSTSRPAPRFSRTPAGTPGPAPEPGADTRALLAEAGLTDPELTTLRADGVIAWPGE